MPSEVAAIPRGCLINGKWIARGEVSEVRSPYDGSVVGAVHLATKEDAEAAIQACCRRIRDHEEARVLPAKRSSAKDQHTTRKSP